MTVASIQTGIELHDGFTGVMSGIISTVQSAVAAMEAMQGTMSADIDTAGMEEARDGIDQTAMAVAELEQAVSGLSALNITIPQSGLAGAAQVVNTDPFPVQEAPAGRGPLESRPQVLPNAPPVPDTYDEAIAEITMHLNEVSRMQQSINEVSKHMYILPEETAGEIGSINRQIVQMEQALEFIKNNPFDLDSSVAELQIRSISAGLDDLGAKQQKLDSYLDNIPSQTVQLDVQVPEAGELFPEPVRIPVEWQTDNLEVFSGSGMERFRQEVQSADFMLQRLCDTQDAIAKQAYNMNILPPEAFRNLNSLAVRMDGIRDRIRQIEGNPVNIGTDQASRELEQLRGQLNELVNEQNDLTAAMADMDVGAANAAYLRLSQTVSGTERYIRDNVDEQGRFNREVQNGTQQADNLLDTIKRAAAAYVSIQSVGKVINLSDSMIQTTARLELIVDDDGSIDELQNKLYASAQNARGSYMATADAVSKLGMQASQAFTSNDELIAFTELLNKSFVNAGTSVQGVDSVMLQLTQSMAAGKLQGEELNAVLDNAAPIVQNIQRYLEEVQNIDAGNIKELASEGVITADVVKNAMFYAADDINAKFESMPMTWGQTLQSIQNTALIAFQPVFQRLNDLADSEAFQAFVNGAVQTMAVLANIVLEIFELVAAVGGFIVDNWSVISPVIYTVVAVMAVYAAYLAIIKGIEIASAVATAVMTGAKLLASAAMVLFTGATWGAATAQMGLNSAMQASPVMWIVILIVGLIALLVLLCNWIAEVTGAADSGIGIIVGALSVGCAFIGNLFVALVNFALDLFVALWNFIAAFANFFGDVFNDPVGAIVRLFFDLVDTIFSLLQSLASAIDTIFGSNLSDAVQGWRDSISGWVDENFGQGTEVMEKLSAEDMHLERFEYDRAWNSGVALGDKISEKVSDFSLEDVFGSTDIPNVEDYTSGFDDVMTENGMAGNLGDIADNTGSIKDSLDCTEEDLKYLRDIAEQEAVNRYTVAEVKIEQTNYNDIGGSMDLDGVMAGLTESVKEAADSMAEGVHE